MTKTTKQYGRTLQCWPPADRSAIRGGRTMIPIVCAWCGTVLQHGDPEEPISHGICQRCETLVLEQNAARDPVPSSHRIVRWILFAFALAAMAEIFIGCGGPTLAGPSTVARPVCHDVVHPAYDDPPQAILIGGHLGIVIVHHPETTETVCN